MFVITLQMRPNKMKMKKQKGRSKRRKHRQHQHQHQQQQRWQRRRRQLRCYPNTKKKNLFFVKKHTQNEKQEHFHLCNKIENNASEYGAEV